MGAVEVLREGPPSRSFSSNPPAQKTRFPTTSSRRQNDARCRPADLASIPTNPWLSFESEYALDEILRKLYDPQSTVLVGDGAEYCERELFNEAKVEMLCGAE